MMSSIKEDYLKIIFELGGSKKQVTNKNITAKLHIAAGSVTEMVNKLVAEHLLVHKPYSGTTLTSKGLKLAEMLIRRHRIWEVFLVRKLGYKISDVDEEAQVLEHVTSPKLLNALDRWLGYPKTCPHGGVIPNGHGRYRENSNLTLGAVHDGQTIIVDRFIDNHDLLTYLGALGIDLGDKLKVVRHAPFEGSLIVRNLSDHTKITVGLKAAQDVFVKKVK